MWPFNNSLKDKLRNQDALKKYDNWLKKWFLKGTKFYAIGLSIALVTLIGTFLGVKYLLPAAIQPVNETINPNKTVATEKATEQPKPKQTQKKEQPKQQAEQYVDINQLTMPVTGRVLLSFNEPYYSETYQDYRFSDGIKFNTTDSEAVTAALPGKVIATEQDQQNNYTVTINHGQGYQTKYTGLATIAVKVNQQITQSQTIGTATNNLTFALTKDGVAINPEQ